MNQVRTYVKKGLEGIQEPISSTNFSKAQVSYTNKDAMPMTDRTIQALGRALMHQSDYFPSLSSIVNDLFEASKFTS